MANLLQHRSTFLIKRKTFYLNKKWIEGLDIFRNLGFDKILDYRNIFDVNQEYFLDSDHVNLTGSEILTAKLNKDLKKILKPYGSEQ